MSSDRVLDPNEYPQRWSEYIGQENAKAMLQVAAKSARIRKEPLDHVLITHPTPGIGKTALALLIAKDLRTKVHIVSGTVTRDKARLKLSEMKDRDVLFYDEFHEVLDSGVKNAGWLLHYLQDGVIMGPLGKEEYPRVTIVAATTEIGKLAKIPAVVSRFTQVPPMVDYTAEEAAKIAIVQSKKLLVPDMPSLRMSDALLLAAAAHNNPRSITKMLKVLRDTVITDTLSVTNGRYDIPGLLVFQGITEDGLDWPAQQYLRALAEEFAGTAGSRALEERLQQPGGLTQVERLLMDKGFVARTRTGRSLTKAGILRSRELAS